MAAPTRDSVEFACAPVIDISTDSETFQIRKRRAEFGIHRTSDFEALLQPMKGGTFVDNTPRSEVKRLRARLCVSQQAPGVSRGMPVIEGEIHVVGVVATAEGDLQVAGFPFERFHFRPVWPDWAAHLVGTGRRKACDAVVL